MAARRRCLPAMPATPIAAIVYGPDDDMESLLARVARTLAAHGTRLGGVIQHTHAADNDSCGMQLENLETGERFGLSLAAAPGATACRLDPDALARGAVAIRDAVARGVELLIVNKFGAQEAAGAGLRAEMGLAAAAGIPLLTAVAERFLADWQAFAGPDTQLLPPDPERVLAWWIAPQTDA